MRSPWNMWSDVTFMSVNPLMPLSQLPKSCFGKVCVELYSLVTWHGWFSNLERNGICFDIEYRHTFELLSNVNPKCFFYNPKCFFFNFPYWLINLIIIVQFSVLYSLNTFMYLYRLDRYNFLLSSSYNDISYYLIE